MESLGQKLKAAREQMNLTLEQVARDTHISKYHLKALEDEDFAGIPGETYVIGFLRNYAEYLSLNPDEITSLYRNLKIQEQPLPMNELLQGQDRRPRTLLLLLVFAALLAGVGVFFIIRALSAPAGKASAAKAKQEIPGKTGQREVVFQDEVLTSWFNLKDVVRVPLEGTPYALELSSISDKLTLKIPGGTIELNIGEERQLDLNADGKSDLRVLLNDLDSRAEPRRANLGLYKLIKSAAVAGPLPAPETPAQAETAAPAAAEAQPLPAEAGPPAPPALSMQGESLVIQKADAPAPFKVAITFRGYCLLRYLLDGQDREERFFHKGETFTLDPKREVKLWMSNAGSLRTTVAGREVELGRAGELAVRAIRWSKDEGSAGYRLEIVAVN